MSTTKRPKPEEVLARVQEEEQQEKRGKLKIFLGAAPGVGKTYSMLQDAKDKRSVGLDVLVGVVETHGRKEVDNLLKGFEILPRLMVSYKGQDLDEFDLDEALRRSPAIIVIDEMAHTNAPGLRHEKRWQDIKEILDRGIDVYTTLNVQHVESLNDAVAQITGVHVRETVPDSFLDGAAIVELVDLPVEDLLKRFEEGKVYLPRHAEFARQHFFQQGNLIALRELALRYTAELVDTKVLLHRRGQQVDTPWPTSERFLVYAGSDPGAARVIRSARRMATRLHAQWIVVDVEIPRVVSSEAQQSIATHNLRLAEQLGAEIHTLNGLDVAQEIIRFAKERNVTRIILGKQARPRWKDVLGGSLVDDLLRQSEGMDIFIIHGDNEIAKSSRPLLPKREVPWKIYGQSLALLAMLTGVNLLLAPYLQASNLMMIYLLGTLLVAMQGYLGPAMMASTLSVFAYDFFFVPPRNNVSFVDFQYLITLVVMLLVSQVICQLTLLNRRQAENSRLRERQTSALYGLSLQLAQSRGVDKILEASIRYISEVFESNVSAFLPQKEQLVLQGAVSQESLLNAKEESVAQWVFHSGQIAGKGTDTLPFSEAIYVPLSTSQGTLGVLRVRPHEGSRLFNPEQLHLLETCSNQIALALHVDQLRSKTIR